MKKHLISKTAIVLTGSFKNMTRAEAKKMLEGLGAKITSSVSSKTDYLITGENPGSKVDKAQKLNIEILDESYLSDLI